jgi:signal peptidase II
MPERSYRALLWALALTGLLLDQVSKYGTFGWLEGVESNTYALFQTEPGGRYFAEVPSPFDLQRDRGFFLTAGFERSAEGHKVPHVNHGALFGFLREHKTGANAGFAVISMLAALAIIFWSTQKSTASDRWLCAALGLILAGTLGNAYDRLMFNGVRDFLHWNYLFNWPVFNVADCCLVSGAALLLIQAFSAQPQPEKAPVETDGAALATQATLPETPATSPCASAASGPSA